MPATARSLFGQPFYAGWGLTDDRNPTRTPADPPPQPDPRPAFRRRDDPGAVWYDPCRDRLCQFEEAVDQLEAETRAFREDRHGHVATGMRLWKRGRLQAVFGAQKPLIFRTIRPKPPPSPPGKPAPLLIWAGKEPEGFSAPTPILRVEDGFLRSRGLGATLIPPLSLVTDDLGIYYDPTRPSRLEALIMGPLPPGGHSRAERLIAALTAAGVTKYNVGSTDLPALPPGHRILVPGQVEDDASILKGGGAVRTNLGLLQAAIAANPGAVILYKPHPDVEAGLRPGAIATLPAGVLSRAEHRRRRPVGAGG